VDAFGVVAIVTPAGSVSVRARPVSATAAPSRFEIVICRTDVAPLMMDAGVNVFVTATAGAFSTVNVALAPSRLLAP